MRNLLETTNLNIGYQLRGGQKLVHQKLNLSLAKGELTSLLGVNGVGKSTLLRTLAGFQPKLSGDIMLDGRSIGSYSQRERAKLVSVVLTDQVVVGDLFVYEVIALGRHPYLGFFGRLTLEDHKVIEKVVHSVGIDELTHRRISSLSDGERQKVMIAKALAQQTPIIILDEPTAFLDLPSRIEIAMLLRKLSDGMGKAILLSTHDLDLALDLSDKLWLMGKEREVACGAPEDLVLSGIFNSYFERDSIVFDRNIGRFRLNEKHEKLISLDADAGSHFWIEKALHRNGFAVAKKNTGKESHLRVDRNAKRPYKLASVGSKEMEFETINELLVELKN